VGKDAVIGVPEPVQASTEAKAKQEIVCQKCGYKGPFNVVRRTDLYQTWVQCIRCGHLVCQLKDIKI